MPQTEQELRERRGKLAAELQELSDKEHNWSSEDADRFRTCGEEYDAVMEQLEEHVRRRGVLARREGIEADNQRLQQPGLALLRGGSITGPQRHVDGDMTLINHATGQRIPYATRDKPFPLTREEQEMDLGRCLLSGLLGVNILTDAERRAMDSSIPGIPESWASMFLDNLRPLLVSVSAGATLVPMSEAALNIVRVDDDVAATWLAELAADSSSDPALSTVQLTPHRMQSTTIISGEALADSINAGEIIVTSASGAHSVALDAAVINGDGTNKPTGILQAAGTQEIPTVGSFTWDVVAQAYRDLLNANYAGTLNELALVCNPADGYALRTEKASTAGTYLAGSAWTSQVRMFETSGCPAGSAILGDWRTVFIGQRLVEGEWYRAGTDGTTNLLTQYARAYRLVTRTDAVLTRPNQFVKMTGIT